MGNFVGGVEVGSGADPSDGALGRNVGFFFFSVKDTKPPKSQPRTCCLAINTLPSYHE